LKKENALEREAKDEKRLTLQAEASFDSSAYCNHSARADRFLNQAGIIKLALLAKNNPYIA
jgi:hypothetical protein